MKNGNTGVSALWDGPLNMEGRPTAKGNSRNHMEISKAHCGCGMEPGKPITQCAKEGY